MPDPVGFDGAPRTSRAVRIQRPGDRRSLSRSATRALDVLEVFGTMKRPLRAIEISQMLGLSRSTTDQLLKTMVGSAHLVFNAQAKTYQPSLRLVNVSRWIIDTYGADNGLRDLVSDVQRRTGMFVTLTVPNDLSMQIIDFAKPEEDLAERGLRISVFGSAIGSAYLSALESDAVIRLAERARISSGEMSAIFAGLEIVRQRGYAHGPNNDRIWSIAMPILERRLPFPMVLGLAGPSGEVSSGHKRIYELMHETVETWANDSKGGLEALGERPPKIS